LQLGRGVWWGLRWRGGGKGVRLRGRGSGSEGFGLLWWFLNGWEGELTPVLVHNEVGVKSAISPS
jgi:hypothetical protein